MHVASTTHPARVYSTTNEPTVLPILMRNAWFAIDEAIRNDSSCGGKTFSSGTGSIGAAACGTAHWPSRREELQSLDGALRLRDRHSQVSQIAREQLPKQKKAWLNTCLSRTVEYFIQTNSAYLSICILAGGPARLVELSYQEFHRCR